MIAAVGSVLLTPWNWYNNDDAIHYTLGILGALIGPLFGILIAGYYLISKQRVWVDDMYTMEHDRPLLVHATATTPTRSPPSSSPASRRSSLVLPRRAWTGDTTDATCRARLQLVPRLRARLRRLRAPGAPPAR